MAQQDRSKEAAYQALLARVQTLDLGTSGFWKPSVGKHAIRIVPPVGNMEVFFVESGNHFLSRTSVFPCLRLSGQGPCPICDTNEGLYQAGKKAAAATFRASKQYLMNIIVRSNKGGEDTGPLIWPCGVMVMNSLVGFIADPEYGDISDPETGVDIVITRTGEGQSSRYQVSPKRHSTPLGPNAEQWLADAKDLTEEVKKKLMSYEALAEKSGVGVYLTDGVVPSITEAEQEQTQDEDTEDDDDEIEDSDEVEEERPRQPKEAAKPSASSEVQNKLKARLANLKK